MLWTWGMKGKTTPKDASALKTFPELPRVGIPKQPRSCRQTFSKPVFGENSSGIGNKESAHCAGSLDGPWRKRITY